MPLTPPRLAVTLSPRMPDDTRRISRRQFARSAALASAAAALPGKVFAQAEKTTATPVKPPAEEGPQLSPAARAEAEQKIQWILQRYGSRLSDAEKPDIRRLVLQGQKSLEDMRAFPLDNGDAPALVLKFTGEPQQ